MTDYRNLALDHRFYRLCPFEGSRENKRYANFIWQRSLKNTGSNGNITHPPLSFRRVSREVKYANCIWHVRVMNDQKMSGTRYFSALLRISRMDVLSSWRNWECHYVYRYSLILVVHNDTDKSRATLIAFNSALIIQNDIAMLPVFFRFKRY